MRRVPTCACGYFLRPGWIESLFVEEDFVARPETLECVEVIMHSGGAEAAGGSTVTVTADMRNDFRYTSGKGGGFVHDRHETWHLFQFKQTAREAALCAEPYCLNRGRRWGARPAVPGVWGMADGFSITTRKAGHSRITGVSGQKPITHPAMRSSSATALLIWVAPVRLSSSSRHARFLPGFRRPSGPDLESGFMGLILRALRPVPAHRADEDLILVERVSSSAP